MSVTSGTVRGRIRGISDHVRRVNSTTCLRPSGCKQNGRVCSRVYTSCCLPQSTSTSTRKRKRKIERVRPAPLECTVPSRARIRRRDYTLYLWLFSSYASRTLSDTRILYSYFEADSTSCTPQPKGRAPRPRPKAQGPRPSPCFSRPELFTALWFFSLLFPALRLTVLPFTAALSPVASFLSLCYFPSISISNSISTSHFPFPMSHCPLPIAHCPFPVLSLHFFGASSLRISVPSKNPW